MNHPTADHVLFSECMCLVRSVKRLLQLMKTSHHQWATQGMISWLDCNGDGICCLASWQRFVCSFVKAVNK